VLNISSHFAHVLQAFYSIKEYMRDFYEVLLIDDCMLTVIVVKIKEGGLDLFCFSFHFYFLFNLFFYFSIFRTTRVRVDRSCHHISHLMA